MKKGERPDGLLIMRGFVPQEAEIRIADAKPHSRVSLYQAAEDAA